MQGQSYGSLLADIMRQLNRTRTEISPEMGAEIQRHLNRVPADVVGSAKPFEDADYWEGTVYGTILRLKEEVHD